MLENSSYGGDGWNPDNDWLPEEGRLDNNGDGTCNKADAHTTFDDHGRFWEDDVIPLDTDGVARPVIGLGFSTARPLDIRAGGGEDEVSYNVNAPVSVDGGTGFDKLVVLGTEFADDFAITAKTIYGAGLNVRYTTIEVVEVDGLEGDDEFFVISTAYGVAYRVIGGLGSDTINIGGDVVEDIVTRELEGVSGTIDHRVTSDDDPLYDGLAVDGIDYNLATPDIGQVIIGDEGDEGTSVREGGSSTVPDIDSYSVKLAAAPTHNVYVTVSAAGTPQEEAEDTFSNPEPTDTSNSLADGEGDTIWLCTGSATDCQVPTDFQRAKTVNGSLVYEDGRAVVLTFTPGNWTTKQWVFVYAVDDLRSEGDRVVVVQHSTISQDDDFDAVAVRNVEVSLRDNDTPGVFVTEVKPGGTTEDGGTLVIEGFDFGGTDTGRTDDLLVQLQKDPGAVTVRVKIVMDADTQAQIQLSNPDADARFQQWSHVDADPMLSFTYYTIDFDTSNWDVPVRITVNARPDADNEDPFTAVIRFERDDDDTDLDGNDACTTPGDTDSYTIRLTKRPEALDDDLHTQTPIKVDVAVLVDGLSDVISIDGSGVTPAGYEIIGGLVPSQRFFGNLEVAGNTIMRANGSELESFHDEGFQDGDHLSLRINGSTYEARIDEDGTSEDVLTVTWIGTVPAGGIYDDAAISTLHTKGTFDGAGTIEGPEFDHVAEIWEGWTLVRTEGGWLADGFLEGQWVEICQSDGSGGCTNIGRFKIQVIRGDNKTKDNELELRYVRDELALLPDFEDSLSGWGGGTYIVNRIAAVASFDDNDWFMEQSIVLEADIYFRVPIARDGVKIFPASKHGLWKLQGPVAVEGGVTGADRSLKLGLKLPGEHDGPLFAIGTQPPESKQIDVLNIFNDGSKENGTGTLTSTHLTGFGLVR
jgi:hypothetical protein